jgi:hypothetical protein
VTKIKMLSPIEQAQAVLGEHYRHYVILATLDDEPLSFEAAFSDPYAAKGILYAAQHHHESYLLGETHIDTDEY